MIAEARTWREQRQQQDRRRCAARQRTLETLWEDVAKPGREDVSELLGTSLASEPVTKVEVEECNELPHREGDGSYIAGDASARQFVFPNVIAGEAPVVRKPGPTFADVLRTFDGPYRRRYGAEMTVQQDKVLREMLACYTKVLGVHQWTCGDCGTVVELPNGCNNRHCCTCGSTNRWRWAQRVCSQILPVEYCHLILTVPKPITQLAMINQRELYALVLSEGAYAVLACGQKLFGIELALLTLLHSWGQLMLNHVHSHSLMPMGGLRAGSLEWIDLSDDQLQQLRQEIMREFPNRFCKALRKSYKQGKLRFDGDAELEHLRSPAEFEQWLRPWENMAWIVRCGDNWDRTKMDHGPEATMKIIQYLANYVGRVALSDSRILDIQGDQVLFKYKDYRDDNQQKDQWIEGVELIHRFLQHLLPRSFRHLRKYGWMGPHPDEQKLEFIRQYHGREAWESDESESDESQEQSEELDEAPLGEQERTQTCRFCRGAMHLTGSTPRPRVSEILEMPLSRFRQAQAGFTVTLGNKLPQIEAERSGDESAPVMGKWARQVRAQVESMIHSGYT